MPAVVDNASGRGVALKVKAKRKPKPVTIVPGLGEVTRPTPRMRNAARTAERAKPKPRTPRKPTAAEQQLTKARANLEDAKEKQRRGAARAVRNRKPDPKGPFTKKPVEGMLKAEADAIKSLSSLRASNPDAYERQLKKSGQRERATAGPRGQTVEHFRGRTTGEILTDRPTIKLPRAKKMTVAGFRGQTKPTQQAGVPGGKLLETAVRNAPKNFGDIATGMPTSLVYAAAHPVQAVKDTAKEYAKIATKPEESLAERPVSTVLAASGVTRGVGMGIGKVARVRAARRARAAGVDASSARPHATLPGTKLKEPRRANRGALKRRSQRLSDEQAPPRMTGREVQRQVDEHYDLTLRRSQRARDIAARRAQEQGLGDEETAARIQAAGEGAQRGSDSIFARRFGAHQRPSVGKRETDAAKAAREQAEETKNQAKQVKDAAKAEVAARKAERGSPSAHQTQLEAQRAAALAELASLDREHLTAQLSHERARGNARVSTARRKASPVLADLHTQLKKAQKEDAVVGDRGPRTPKASNVKAKGDKPVVVTPASGPKPRNVSQEVREARQAVSVADRFVNQVASKGTERVTYHRRAEAAAQHAVDLIKVQIQKEEDAASRLEGESTGRYKLGRMTAGMGRRINTQSVKLGNLHDALGDAQRLLDQARTRTAGTHESEVGRARAAADEAREGLKGKEAEERTIKASTLAELRGKIADENRRLSGVGPKQADELLSALDALDVSAAAKHAGRQAIRELGTQIQAERGATRLNQRAAVQAAEADRQAALAEFVARRGEHRTAKQTHISTKATAATAPLKGAAKQGRIFEHRYDANKVAERLNEAGHEVNLSDAPLKSPFRFGYTDQGIRPQLASNTTVPLEYTVVEVPGGRFAVVPHLASEQRRLHNVVGTSKATNAMLLRDTRRGFTRAVLPFSPKWLGGQAGEAGLRSAVEGAGPLDWMRLRRVVRRMNEIEPGSGDEFMMRLPGTHFDVTGEARQALDTPTLAERYKGRWPEQPMAALTAMGQTAPGTLAKQGFAKWNQIVLGKINNAIERGTISAMTGHAIKRDLMNERFMGLTAGAIDDAARGLMDTPRQIAASRAAADMYGKYSNFSPEMRSAITHWTPFLPWYINTLRFLKNTVRDHPIKSSLAVALNSASEDWRSERGLSLYSEDGDRVPDWQLGGYPIVGDKISRVGQFTPFGAFSDPIGALGGLGLPQAGSAFLAAAGVDWTGKPLRDSATGKPFNWKQKGIKTGVSLGESMIPLASQGLRWSGLGPRYIDRKDPESIVPLRSRLAREIPLWPLGDVGGGGGGGMDFEIPEIPEIEVPEIPEIPEFGG